MTKLEQLARLLARHAWDRAWHGGHGKSEEAIAEAVENTWRNYLDDVRVVVEGMRGNVHGIWRAGEPDAVLWAAGPDSRAIWCAIIDAMLKETP